MYPFVVSRLLTDARCRERAVVVLYQKHLDAAQGIRNPGYYNKSQGIAPPVYAIYEKMAKRIETYSQEGTPLGECLTPEEHEWLLTVITGKPRIAHYAGQLTDIAIEKQERLARKKEMEESTDGYQPL